MCISSLTAPNMMTTQKLYFLRGKVVREWNWANLEFNELLTLIVGIKIVKNVTQYWKDNVLYFFLAAAC